MPDIDKSKVSAAFDRAAGAYDAMAQFQHQVCERLAATLPDMENDRKPARILDGGCGTGYGASLLRRHWPEALVVGCDLAPEMARKTLARGIASVCGDLERLPFAGASFDLAWSSLALQWCQPALAYAELQRVLTPGGLLLFSTLGPGTLHELESAFAGIDTHRRVLPFAAASEVEAALAAAGFEQIQIGSENWVTRHRDFKALLASIRGIGANQIGGNRRRGMMGKTAWQAAQARYEALRDDDGLLPATYEVVFGCAARQN
ncbi:malonyl-ACP O-methyltransferase BioC [Herminiimonas sp. CN]|uniref:malonyl-ACP O-methyltransferase BioC n=1 Tax=Herminiimonas sp. CN TaxID=1349818 RepID=UPI000552BD20|nr:malonyl-ACP O-methyltransferase BioC [Herminiimonas sp. CN]